jgi:hypothetical protein
MGRYTSGTLSESERAAPKVFREPMQLATQRHCFIAGQHADAREAFHVRAAGGNVVQEEFAIQQHVIACKKTHDALVGAGA